MNMKKMISMVLVLVMMLTMSMTAFAQDVDAGKGGNATITIQNAAKGTTYAVYKLFDATVANGSIAYTGDVPTALSNYFVKDSAGNITATAAAKNGDELTDDAIAALTAWAETATADASVVSDGSVLKFTGLKYGYYVVTTTQGETAITVVSTQPNAVIYDKNSTTPKDLLKEVDDEEVFIGQTVTYTVSFTTSNFSGSGEDAKKIEEYTIHDTLPDFLSDVTVTKITIGDDEYKVDGAVPQFNNDKQIVIPWVDATTGNSLYENGAQVVITYTATVSDSAAIDGNGNENKVTLTWGDDDFLEKEEIIFTYAIALKKVNEKGEALAGATFQFPFYVKETPDDDGAYIYAGKNAGDGLTNTITTPDSGEIVVKGVEQGTYTVTEIAAPAGYNMLTAPISVTAVKTEETTTTVTKYIDENGNVVNNETKVVVEYSNDKIAASVVIVVNKSGAVLPSTGAQGTKMIYIAGGILVAAAAVLLIAKRRMDAAE